MKRLVCIGLLGALVLGCANSRTGGRTPYPSFTDSRTSQAIATGYFAAGWHAMQFPECLQPLTDTGIDIICLDPPPMILDFKTEDVIAGELPKQNLRLFTTSHFGLDSVDFGEQNMFLVCVVTDGKSFIMPRYRKRWLATNTSQELALQTNDPESLSYWLPQERLIQPKPMRFRGLKIEVEDFTPEELAALGNSVEVDGGWVRPLRGVELDEIESEWSGNESAVHCAD